MRYHCRSCKAEIVWLWSSAEKKKKMPIDMATYRPGDTVFDPSRHVAHFANCPDAAKWRKPKGVK